jgi:hypothetical protein
LTADEIAAQLHTPDEVETIFHILRHLEVAGRVHLQSGIGPRATYVTS